MSFITQSAHTTQLALVQKYFNMQTGSTSICKARLVQKVARQPWSRVRLPPWTNFILKIRYVFGIVGFQTKRKASLISSEGSAPALQALSHGFDYQPGFLLFLLSLFSRRLDFRVTGTYIRLSKLIKNWNKNSIALTNRLLLMLLILFS